jgi:hypothetical protein
LGLKKKIFFSQTELSQQFVLFELNLALLQSSNLSGVEWCTDPRRDEAREKEFQVLV